MIQRKTKIRSYVITTYLVFWLMVLVLCGGASMIFNAPEVVMRILSNICAWSPTIVLIIMWKKLRPNQKMSFFFKECFKGKLRLKLLVVPFLVAGSTLLSVWILSLMEGKVFTEYFSLGTYPFWASILFSITTGPTGEELGWRGYLREELNEKYPFLKASIYQGLIWAFWHAVLWIVDCEFTGALLIPYIAANVIVMSALAVIMNVVLEQEKNLIYAVLIHFAFNFVYCFLQIDIWFYAILSVSSVLLATVIYKLWKR